MSEGAARHSAGRRNGKSAEAFRTISEVASELDVPSHVLRFWETKFSQVRPLKRGGGRRYYRPEDVELLRRIRSLLYDDGYTIKGVQKLLRQGGQKNDGDEPAKKQPAPAANPEPAEPAASAASGNALRPDQRSVLNEILTELEALRDSTRNI